MKACLIMENGGYDAAIKDDTWREMLVFGLRSDKVFKDAVALGSLLTVNAVFNMVNIDEIQKVITLNEDTSDLLTV